MQQRARSKTLPSAYLTHSIYPQLVQNLHTYAILFTYNRTVCAGKEYSFTYGTKNKSVKPEAALLPSGKTAVGRVSMCPTMIRKPASCVVIPIYGKTQKEVAEKLRAATSSIDNGTFQEPRKNHGSRICRRIHDNSRCHADRFHTAQLREKSSAAYSSRTGFPAV